MRCTFWYKMINLSTFASFEDEHFFRSPLCTAQRSRESGVLRGHLFPYFHFHPSSSICDISLAGSHRIFGIILQISTQSCVVYQQEINIRRTELKRQKKNDAKKSHFKGGSRDIGRMKRNNNERNRVSESGFPFPSSPGGPPGRIKRFLRLI